MPTRPPSEPELCTEIEVALATNKAAKLAELAHDESTAHVRYLPSDVIREAVDEYFENHDIEV